MPSEFDTLVRELRAVAANRPADAPMRKSYPADTGPITVTGLSARRIDHMKCRLDNSAKSLAAQSASMFRQRGQAKRDEFLKSLAGTITRIRALPPASFSPAEALTLERKLQEVIERARPFFAGRP